MLCLLVLLMAASVGGCKGGELNLESPAFADGGLIPEKYTIDGEKVSPPLEWSNVPDGAKSLALVMVDYDVPPEYGGKFIHWMVYDIPVGTREFADGASPSGYLPTGTKEFPNAYSAFGRPELTRYGPPWPPAAHRYQFTLYALSVEQLVLPPDTNQDKFVEIVKANSIATSNTLIGIYGPAKLPLPTG